MKKIYGFIILLSIMGVKNVNAQWTSLLSGSSAELRSAYFLNSNTGFVVGSDSIILKTTNYGTNWSPLLSGTIDTLRCIYFTDDTTGYAVGAQGTIIKTTNACNSWSAQTSGNTNLLRSVHFPTHDTGYIAGGNGCILKTTDGGNNWLPQVSGTAQDLISTRFVNADTGFVVSSLGSFFSGLILKTINGGNTWDTAYVHNNGFLSVFPINKDTIYAAGGFGTIVKSTDGGSNWSVQSSGLTSHIRAIFFITSDSGFACGDSGKVVFTANGGNTWINQSVQTTGLLGLYFPSHDTGYAVGAAGVILRYSTPCNLASEPVQIYGGTTICEGDSVSYYIAPVNYATSYTWTGPPGSTVVSGQGDTLAVIVFGSVSGNVSVTADNLCGSGIPHNQLVTVNALPPAPVITINGSNLVSTSANAYQWYLNGILIPGADSSFYYPLQNGSYTVVVTNAFGCTAASSPFIVINAGVDDAAENEFTIHPIPASDYFIITWKDDIALLPVKSIILYDMQGKVKKEILAGKSKKTTVDISDFDAGMYFYTVITQSNIFYRGKLIKQ